MNKLKHAKLLTLLMAVTVLGTVLVADFQDGDAYQLASSRHIVKLRSTDSSVPALPVAEGTELASNAGAELPRR